MQSRESLAENLISRTEEIFSMVLILAIKFYQVSLGPMLGGQCRFIPSCSNFALEVARTNSPWSAIVSIFLRICKCHPLHKGGIDLPPTHKGDCCAGTKSTGR